MVWSAVLAVCRGTEPVADGAHDAAREHEGHSRVAGEDRQHPTNGDTTDDDNCVQEVSHVLHDTEANAHVSVACCHLQKATV